MRGAIMSSLIFSLVLSFVSRQKKEQAQTENKSFFYILFSPKESVQATTKSNKKPGD
jgi:hypothetical protein